MLPLVGCQKNTVALEEQPFEIDTGPVTQAGLALDASATPEQVVYALLRAIYDDVKANDVDTRRQAFQRELDLSAPDTIYARSRYHNLTRNEGVKRIVWHWAPTLAYHVDDFPKSWNDAASRLRSAHTGFSQSPNNSRFTRVLIELADPSGDPNASVIAQFQLTNQPGGLWRVTQVGFIRTRRHLTPPSPSLDVSS